MSVYFNINENENKNVLFYFEVKRIEDCLVETNGIEPLTSCVQGRRSSQLSYAPKYQNDNILNDNLKTVNNKMRKKAAFHKANIN